VNLILAFDFYICYNFSRIYTGGESMANIKQQIKRVRTNEKARLQNASFKSSMKTAIKNVYASVEAKDKEKAVAALNLANKKLDKAQAKGLVHKNFVARHKSELAKAVNSLN
jgi:small subunit ribosomal protein S20